MTHLLLRKKYIYTHIQNIKVLSKSLGHVIMNGLCIFSIYLFKFSSLNTITFVDKKK